MDSFFDTDIPSAFDMGMTGDTSPSIGPADVTIPDQNPIYLSELAASDADGVIVIDNQTVILDSAEVEGILVSGTEARLYADDTMDVSVTANWILVVNGGMFEIGTETDLFDHDLTLTLETEDMGRDIDVNALLGTDMSMSGTGGGDMGGMGMQVTDNDGFLMAMGMGSSIEIHAADAEKESWAQLTQTVIRQDDVLYLDKATGWEVGDRIAVAPTGLIASHAEEFTIVEVRDDGREIVLDAPIQTTHYGVIETYDNGATGEDYLSWDIDMRAEVALLSRNVTIQGDEASLIDGLGAHTMVMMGADQHIEGVELTRVGQRDILGRYPVHWHMLGDTDGENQYLRNSSIHHSYQKITTIHGTNDVTVQNIVGFDHVGHGLFFEDGSENDNLIVDNLIFGTRASATGEPIPTDQTDPSSYWIENPNNTFIGNHAAGSEGHGFRIAPALTPHGLSASEFPDAAGQMSDLIFRDNTVHSSQTGVMIEGFVDPDSLMLVDDLVSSGSYTIEGLTAYSIKESAIWIRGDGATVVDARIADSFEPVFFHASNVLKDSVIVAGSLNPSLGKTMGNDTRGGVRFYRLEASGLDGVHFVNFDQDSDAITMRTSDIPTSLSWGRNLSFENTSDDNRFTFLDKDHGRIEANTTAFLDLDGSLTGTAGGALTLGTPHYGGLAITGNSVWSHDFGAWITDDATPVTMDLNFRQNVAELGTITVTRSDGTVLSDPPVRFQTQLRFLAATESDPDAVYTLDFEHRPEAMEFNASGLPEGESLTYRMEASSGYRQPKDQNVPIVYSYEDLMAATETTLYHDGTHLYVRLVGAPVPPGSDAAGLPNGTETSVRVGRL